MCRDINSKGFLLGKQNRKPFHLHSPHWNYSPRWAGLRPLPVIEHIFLESGLKPSAKGAGPSESQVHAHCLGPGGHGSGSQELEQQVASRSRQAGPTFWEGMRALGGCVLYGGQGMGVVQTPRKPS